MAKKRPILLLPKGTAVYPKLDEVDVYQPKKKDGTPKGPQIRKFMTYVKYEPEVQAQVEKMLRAAAEELSLDPKTVGLPFKDGKEDGEKLLVAKRAEKLGPPPMFDGRNNKLPTLALGGGSIIRVEVSVNDNENDDGDEFINLYLNQVKVYKFVEKSFGKSSFEDDYEEGSFVYDGEKAEKQTADHNEGEESDIDL